MRRARSTCIIGGRREMAFSYTPVSATTSWYVKPALGGWMVGRGGGGGTSARGRGGSRGGSAEARAKPQAVGQSDPPSFDNREPILPAYQLVKPFTRKDMASGRQLRRDVQFYRTTSTLIKLKKNCCDVHKKQRTPCPPPSPSTRCAGTLQAYSNLQRLKRQKAILSLLTKPLARIFATV
jgi:hypothetical protein